MTQSHLPYFDYLLSQLDGSNPTVERSLRRHVHLGYWDLPESARYDDTDFADAAERAVVELCRFAEVADGQRVLDVGCGFGGTIASLNERFSGLGLIGVNIDGRQLTRAQQLVQPRDGNRVDFFQADACCLPFATGSFDCVLAVECIFHFPSRAAFLAEAHRVVRPNGVLAIADFVPSPAFWPIGRLMASNWVAGRSFLGRTDLACTLAGYRRLAEQTGWSITAVRDVTRQTLPNYRHFREMVASVGPIDAQAFGVPVWAAAAALRVGEFIAASGLLKYCLLSLIRQ